MQVLKHGAVTARIEALIHKSNRNMLRLVVLSSLAIATPLFAANDEMQMHPDHGHVPAKLVEHVREATRQYIDVNAATAAGYEPFLGCVSGPDQGAMGIHYVKGGPLMEGEPEASQPQALIYEPSGDRRKLVGVEYIVDAASWLKKHSGAPVLEGQVFQMVTSPNRYSLPNFYELHVWAWRDSPNGAFVDWNTHVTCDGAQSQ